MSKSKADKEVDDIIELYHESRRKRDQLSSSIGEMNTQLANITKQRNEVGKQVVLNFVSHVKALREFAAKRRKKSSALVSPRDAVARNLLENEQKLYYDLAIIRSSLFGRRKDSQSSFSGEDDSPSANGSVSADGSLSQSVVDTSQSVRDASCSGVATDDESVLSEAAAFTEGAMDAASQEKYNRFFRWMLANGAEFSNLILKQYAPGHRGLLARRNIPPNHTFMSIPRALLITRELCLSSNIGQRLSRYDMETEEMVIAAFLLQERDDSNSKWQPYISSLPEDFSFMPVFYSNEFIAKWLKGSVAVGKIRECQKLLRTEYTQLCRVTLQWSFEEFAWASLVVLTRQFCITVEGEETTALVPLADLLNHKRPKESVWDYSDRDGGTFIVTSLVDIKKSHQIFDSYGCKCNSRLLVNYGFAVHENINTEAMFRLGLDQTDPLFPDHRKLLGMDELDIAITIEYAAAASRRCFAWLRIALANTLDVAALTAAAKGKAWIDDERSVLPLGRVNEIDVLRVLQIAARHALLAFDCSVEEDDQLLAEGGLDHLVGEDREKIDAVRNCIVVRRGEKQVCRFYQDLYTHAQPFFNLKDKNSFHRLFDATWKEKSPQSLVHKAVADYLYAVWRPLCTNKEYKGAASSAEEDQSCGTEDDGESKADSSQGDNDSLSHSKAEVNASPTKSVASPSKPFQIRQFQSHPPRMTVSWDAAWPASQSEADEFSSSRETRDPDQPLQIRQFYSQPKKAVFADAAWPASSDPSSCASDSSSCC